MGSETWSSRCEALRNWASTRGVWALHRGERVDIDGESVDLYMWCVRQRVAYRKGTLSDERVAMLESIRGWQWRPRFGPPPAIGVALEWIALLPKYFEDRMSLRVLAAEHSVSHQSIAVRIASALEHLADTGDHVRLLRAAGASSDFASWLAGYPAVGGQTDLSHMLAAWIAHCEHNDSPQ